MKNYTTRLTNEDIANKQDIAGSGEPAAYLKSAEVEDNKLNLKNKDDTITVYEPDLSSYRLAYEQDIIDNAAKDRLTAIEDKEAGWDAKSVVSGTASGDNWATITIDGTVHNIPQGGGSDVQFDNATIIQGADGKYKTAVGGYALDREDLFADTYTVTEEGTNQFTFAAKTSRVITLGENFNATVVGPGLSVETTCAVVDKGKGKQLKFNDSTLDELTIFIDFPNALEVTVNYAVMKLPLGDYSLTLVSGGGYSKINNNYIDIDGSTITVNAEGKLEASGGSSLTAGSGIKIKDGEISTNFGGNLEREDTEEIFKNKPLQKVTNDFYEATDVEGITLEDIAQYHGALTVMGDFYEAYSLSHDGKRTIDGVETQCIYAYLDSYASYDVYLIQPTEGSYSGKIGILFENLPIEIDVSESALSVYVYSEDVSYINAAVIPLDTGTMERLPNGDIAAIIPEYNAGNGININANRVISTKVSFTYDSSTGTLAIVDESI